MCEKLSCLLKVKLKKKLRKVSGNSKTLNLSYFIIFKNINAIVVVIIIEKKLLQVDSNRSLE